MFESTMMDVGTRLREAREGHGITLHQIAHSTKLSTTMLQCIEKNQFDRLPGGIFAKGYLRAYAAEVGLSPEEVVSDYLAQFPAARPNEELPIASAAAFEDPHAGRDLLVVVIPLVLAVVIYGSFNGSAESPVTPPLELVRTEASIESLITENLSSDALPAIGRRDGGLYLEIHPTGECWVSAIADGRLVVYRLLQRGEHVTIVAREELVLRVGDPHTFAYTLNGEVGRSLGDAEPVTVQITEDNYHRFLDGSAPEPQRAISASATEQVSIAADRMIDSSI